MSLAAPVARRGTATLLLGSALCAGASCTFAPPSTGTGGSSAAISSGSTITIDATQKFQTVVGFGVNGQPRNWGTSGAAVKPALDMLVNDLHATLWRVEIDSGRSDWEATNDNADPSVFNWSYYGPIFADADFQALWGYLRTLNSLGVTNIELAAHGNVACWLGGTQVDNQDEYVETLLAVLEYAVGGDGGAVGSPPIQFRWFSPFNEPNLGVGGGSPEGVALTASQADSVLAKLVTRWNAEAAATPGLSGIKLVTPEVADPGDSAPCDPTNYRGLITGDTTVAPRLAAISHHNYGTGAGADWDGLAIPEWLTETNGFGFGHPANCAYNGTDWSAGQDMADEVINNLESGVSAVLVWTEYDAAHYHSDDHWETWGLLQTNIPGVSDPCSTFTGFCSEATAAQLDGATYTPKVTYYVFKQFSRFAQPGATRISSNTADPDLNVTSLLNPDGTVVIAGRNSGAAGSVAVTLTGLGASTPSSLALYYTTSSRNFASGGSFAVSAGTATVSIPADSVFTLTSAAAPPSTDGGAPDASGTPFDGTTGAADGSSAAGSRSQGCGCSIGRREPPESLLSLALLLFALAPLALALRSSRRAGRRAAPPPQ